MKRASARRTVSYGSGRVGEPGPASRPTNATKAHICSVPSVRREARVPHSRCPSPTPTPCSFTSTKSAAMSKGEHQKNGVVRQWARRGTRPRQPADQRYESAYLFGAICPARGKGAALALPFADTHAMQLHINEISRHVKRGAHAVLLMDRAGWHTTAKLKIPQNITPIPAVPRAGIEPRREHLAVHARQLALQPRL